MPNGSLTSLGLTVQDSLVDHVRYLPSQIWMHDSRLFWLQAISGVQQDGHGVLKRLKEGGLSRCPRTKLVTRKLYSSHHILVTVAAVANQLDELEPKQGKMQVSILVQNLRPVSNGRLPVYGAYDGVGWGECSLKKWLFIINDPKVICVVHVKLVF